MYANANNVFVWTLPSAIAYDAFSIQSGQVFVDAANGAFGAAVGGVSVAVGRSYHIAMVRRSATALELYVNGALTATCTTNVSARSAATTMYLGVWDGGGFGRSDPFNGRVNAAKCWTTALSAAEIAMERSTISPQRVANLYGWWPCLPGTTEHVRDYSDAARHWTQSGTIADEEGVALAWQPMPPVSIDVSPPPIFRPPPMYLLAR